MRSDSGNQPKVSIVIIGRNEAGNLPTCIHSVRQMNYPPDLLEITYVDTDSTDGSPMVARSLGITVYEEHSSFPSPGRARNRGWREARHDIVHFVDGDMTIDPGYLWEAVQHLGPGGVVCVFGRIEERHAARNPIVRALEYPWKQKQPGYIDAPGAGGTFCKSALEEIGGYNPDLLKGQETELGRRLRARGYRILLIEQMMGTHDYGINTFRDLWNRYRGIGRSLAKVMQLAASPSINEGKRAACRNLAQAALGVVTLIGLLLAGLWWAIPLSPGLLALYVTARYWQPARLRKQRIAYFMLFYLLRPAVWAGMFEFCLASWKSRRSPCREHPA